VISEARAQISPLIGFIAANACNRARGKRSATAPLALEAMECIDAIFPLHQRARNGASPSAL
jgi:spore maturation protein SpmA